MNVFSFRVLTLTNNINLSVISVTFGHVTYAKQNGSLHEAPLSNVQTTISAKPHDQLS